MAAHIAALTGVRRASKEKDGLSPTMLQGGTSATSSLTSLPGLMPEYALDWNLKESSINRRDLDAGRRAGIEPVIFQQSIEDLLVEQSVAVERALAFNQMIAERLVKERLSSSWQSSEPEAHGKRNKSDARARLPKVNSDDDPYLAEPLLAQSSDDSFGAGDAGQPSPYFLNQKPASDMKFRMSARRAAQYERKALMSVHMFPSFGEVKQHVVEFLMQPEATVEDHYKASGICAGLARSSFFNNFILFIILLNTGWIAYDTDYNDADILAEADIQFQVMDNLFCGIFTFEMLVRFGAFKIKRLALRDSWFLFDGFLVASMIWETWISWLLYVFEVGSKTSSEGSVSVLRIFRMFRLLRIARSARLLGSVPELLILAKGMVAAVRSVIVVLSLLFLIIYIFAILFTQLLVGIDLESDAQRHFKTVPASANFLMLQVLCGFDADFAYDLSQKSMLCYGLFMLYLLMGSLTLMNMLIGILCDVVIGVAQDEKENNFLREMEFKVADLASSLDSRGRGSVSRIDFEEVIKRPDVILSLTDLGVDVVGLIDFAHAVYEHSEEMSYKHFEHMIMQFRTGKPATLKDVMDTRKQMSVQLSKLLDAFEAVTDFVEYTCEKVDRLQLNNQRLGAPDRFDILSPASQHSLSPAPTGRSIRQWESAPAGDPPTASSSDVSRSLFSGPEKTTPERQPRNRSRDKANHETYNISRLVASPRAYLRDSGVLSDSRKAESDGTSLASIRSSLTTPHKDRVTPQKDRLTNRKAARAKIEEKLRSVCSTTVPQETRAAAEYFASNFANK